MAEQRGRREESSRGTAKGFEFEDVVEEHLRRLARPLGAIVERTSRQSGSLAGEAIVGDLVLEWPDGRRVVIEVKNAKALSLTGKDGILGQLDRAKANREAHAAICVSAQDAFPQEVGPFGVYGDRILVVDEGDGAMLAVALRWATAHTLQAELRSTSFDATVLEDRLQRVRVLAQRFSVNRRTLTEISGSVDKVRDSLEEMRRELIDMVDEAAGELHRGPGAAVVEMRLQAG
jgi:hypothetical protein